MEDKILAEVEPSLLIWARKRLKAPIEIVAEKTHISANSIERYESGDDSPSFEQLRRLAHFYRFNISVFFLPEPPFKLEEITTRFRRLSGDGLIEFSVLLKRELLSLLMKRESFIELKASLGEETKYPTLLATDTPEKVREKIGFKLDEQLKWNDPRIAFNNLRTIFESAGILVYQVKGFKIAEMRACAFSDNNYPIIVLNRADSYNGRIFSLAHELYHIIKKDDDLFLENSIVFKNAKHELNEIEANKFAAEFLVPSDKLSSCLRSFNFPDYKRIIESLSKRFCVSKEVIARLLLERKDITSSIYDEYKFDVKHIKVKEGRGPMPHIDSISLLGGPFARVVLSSLHSNVIDKGVACDLLNIKYKWLNGITQNINS